MVVIFQSDCFLAPNSQLCFNLLQGVMLLVGLLHGSNGDKIMKQVVAKLSKTKKRKQGNVYSKDTIKLSHVRCDEADTYLF